MAHTELTVREAAHRLGVSERTVRRWLNSGRLRGRLDVRRDGQRNLGDQWRVDADSVREVAADVSTDRRRRTPPKVSVADVATAVREESRRTLEQIERLTAEVAELRETVHRLLPPPAAEPEPRSEPEPEPETRSAVERLRDWWRRLTTIGDV